MPVDEVAARAIFVGLAAIEPSLFVFAQLFNGDRKAIAASPEHGIGVAVFRPKSGQLILTFELKKPGTACRQAKRERPRSEPAAC